MAGGRLFSFIRPHLNHWMYQSSGDQLGLWRSTRTTDVYTDRETLQPFEDSGRVGGTRETTHLDPSQVTGESETHTSTPHE